MAVPVRRDSSGRRPCLPDHAPGTESARAHFSEEKYDIIFLNGGIGVRPAMLSLHYLPDGIFAVPVLHNDVGRIYAQAQVNERIWNVAVAASPKIQTSMKNLLPDKPIVTILNGIVIPSEQERARRRPWELPLRLLYVGALSHGQKGVLGIPAILEALRSRGLPVFLTVVGDGKDRGRLEQDFRTSGMTRYVEFRGILDNVAVYQAMRDHHVLLMPSRFEGFPLVSLEAQANGCVPVASRLPGITDVAIESRGSGFLAGIDDAGDFGRHIVALASDAELWRRCSERGMEKAATLFSRDVMGRSCEELIMKLTAGEYSAPRVEPRSIKPVSFRILDFFLIPLISAISRIRKGLSRLVS